MLCRPNKLHVLVKGKGDYVGIQIESDELANIDNMLTNFNQLVLTQMQLNSIFVSLTIDSEKQKISQISNSCLPLIVPSSQTIDQTV